MKKLVRSAAGGLSFADEIVGIVHAGRSHPGPVPPSAHRDVANFALWPLDPSHRVVLSTDREAVVAILRGSEARAVEQGMPLGVGDAARVVSAYLAARVMPSPEAERLLRCRVGQEADR
eukprot:Hpha_TRINITY_DN4567_c0_g1::TRINITY_DN4567_c0_g1_i1::g.115471::m.115471